MQAAPKARTNVKVSVSCTVLLRLDGADPLDPPEPSENDYHRDYEAVWVHLAGCFREIGVTPIGGPPAGWWQVNAYFSFRPEDMPLVAAFLRECRFGVEVCQ